MEIGCMALDGSSAHEAGRKLLAQMYKEKTGDDLPEILTAPQGKPYFKDSSLHFSISHTKGHVFCALAEHPVGIDAEEADRAIRLGLAEKVLSPGEKQQYDAAPDKRRALLTFWVLKEAAAKLSGQGLQGYPNHTEFSLDDPRVTIENGCLLAVMEDKNHAV